MGPELGIPLIVALLWGPTALWLAYRTLRWRRGQQTFGPSSGVSKLMRGSQLAHDEVTALVESDGFWVCGTCRSLNRREADRCYSCRTANGVAGRQASGQLPVSRGVPVMAEGVAGRQASGQLPVSRGVPVMAEGVAGRQASGQLPVSRGVPVMAKVVARSSGEVAVTTVALATPRNALPVPEIAVAAPEGVSSAAPPQARASVPMCPFLGLRNDPLTQYDFPDPGNLCHATSRQGATAVSSPRRLLTGLAGTRRPQPIGLEHQKSCCLTAAHEQCARYPAVEAVAAN